VAETERREGLRGQEVDTAPTYIGDDGARTAEAPTAGLEVLSAEVVESGDPRAGGGEVGGALVLAEPMPRDLHPVLVYLASPSEESRRTMRASLENIAQFISGGEADALTLA
jgi:hypothetical protein